MKKLALVLAALLPLFVACKQQEPATVKVMSYNIRYGTANDGDHVWPNRREAAAAMINDQLLPAPGLCAVEVLALTIAYDGESDQGADHNAQDYLEDLNSYFLLHKSIESAPLPLRRGPAGLCRR